MKTEVYFSNLNGNRAAVRNYANTIASMSASTCNAYVMAFDKYDEILWTVQAGDDLDDVKAAINWQGVRRVEIYDHTIGGTYKTEQVYITSRKSLDEYTNERSAFDFVVISNTTQYTAENWQTVENDNNDTQSDESNEGNQTPAEPSRFTLTAAKVAASVKTYAAKAARRAALLLSLLVVLLLAFSAAFGCVAGLLAIFVAFGITGCVRFFLSLLVMFGPALELGINVECNALAVVARLFPGSFPGCMPFEIFSFWRRMFRA